MCFHWFLKQSNGDFKAVVEQARAAQDQGVVSAIDIDWNTGTASRDSTDNGRLDRIEDRVWHVDLRAQYKSWRNTATWAVAGVQLGAVGLLGWGAKSVIDVFNNFPDDLTPTSPSFVVPYTRKVQAECAATVTAPLAHALQAGQTVRDVNQAFQTCVAAKTTATVLQDTFAYQKAENDAALTMLGLAEGLIVAGAGVVALREMFKRQVVANRNAKVADVLRRDVAICQAPKFTAVPA